MNLVVRWSVVALVAASLALVGWGPAAAPAEQKGPNGPEIAAFQSANFEMSGFFKLDGITVDLTGTGLMAPPDRSSATYKIGPFTLESIVANSRMYTRTRYDPEWTSQDVPAEIPMTIGPASSADYLPKGPYQLLGQERVDGKLVSHWSSELDMGLLLALSELGGNTDDNVRAALKSLKATLEVWVGNDDRQLYKERVLMTLTIPAIEPGGEPVPGTLDLSVLYSKHNQPVTIEPPVRDSGRRRAGLPQVQGLLKSLMSSAQTGGVTPAGI